MFHPVDQDNHVVVVNFRIKAFMPQGAIAPYSRLQRRFTVNNIFKIKTGL